MNKSARDSFLKSYIFSCLSDKRLTKVESSKKAYMYDLGPRGVGIIYNTQYTYMGSSNENQTDMIKITFV